MDENEVPKAVSKEDYENYSLVNTGHRKMSTARALELLRGFNSTKRKLKNEGEDNEHKDDTTPR